MKMYRLRSVNPNPDLFLIAENEAGLSFPLYTYIRDNGIRQMYAYKEDDLQGVDLKDLPEGAYIITEYEHGQVVEANNSGSCTIYKPPHPMKNADQILKEHEDANEMHFHQVDREWIIKAMEEYASLKCDHPGGLVVTSETGQTIHKCLDCGNERPVHDYTDKPRILALSSLIEEWAEEKGILSKATPLTQAIKTKEEVDELYNAILDNNRDEIKDAIGDIMVTLIIQCKMQGMDLEDCLESAYNVIKNRTGKMVDGVFVKD